MAYEIRTNDGTMKVIVSNAVAQKIIQQAQGTFKEIKFVNRPAKITVFELQVDGTINFDQISIPLFVGDRLIPEKIG